MLTPRESTHSRLRVCSKRIRLTHHALTLDRHIHCSVRSLHDAPHEALAGRTPGKFAHCTHLVDSGATSERDNNNTSNQTTKASSLAKRLHGLVLGRCWRETVKCLHPRHGGLSPTVQYQGVTGCCLCPGTEIHVLTRSVPAAYGQLLSPSRNESSKTSSVPIFQSGGPVLTVKLTKLSSESWRHHLWRSHPYH